MLWLPPFAELDNEEEGVRPAVRTVEIVVKGDDWGGVMEGAAGRSQ